MTGEKEPATSDEIALAEKGGVIREGDRHWSVEGDDPGGAMAEHQKPIVEGEEREAEYDEEEGHEDDSPA